MTAWLTKAASLCFLFLIRFYQIFISPMLYLLFPGLGCRFTPTCSEYAIGCLKLYGPFKGMYYTIKRIGRCHPFHQGGVDLPSTLRS